MDSAIGFCSVDVDDPDRRKLVSKKPNDMNTCGRLAGFGSRTAAGATDDPKLDLFAVAERYRALLELGDEMGVIPQLEVWDSQRTCRAGRDSFCLRGSRSPQIVCFAGCLPHLQRGSGFSGLDLLSDSAIQVFHVNDYPAEPVERKSMIRIASTRRRNRTIE